MLQQARLKTPQQMYDGQFSWQVEYSQVSTEEWKHSMMFTLVCICVVNYHPTSTHHFKLQPGNDHTEWLDMSI